MLWEEVLRNERLWSEVCVELSHKADRPSELYEANRSWWFATHEVLAVYNQAQVQLGRTLTPFPGLALMRLSKLTHDLGRGIVSEVIRDASKGRIGRPIGWAERRDIAHAIHYIDACKEGIIADRAYNKTIAQAYDVTSRTVQKWIHGAGSLCANVPRALSHDEIINRMQASGKRYARIGRGASSE
ncbi:MAG: hypothetical protein MRY81_18335 [Donghicola eburneus]|nr:hypothetical protein [Donghicola eburneus]